MDEEEELRNSLIGQQEAFDATNLIPGSAAITDDIDRIIGAPRQIGTTPGGMPIVGFPGGFRGDSGFAPSESITSLVPGIENIRLGRLKSAGTDGPIMSAGTVERVTPFELAGRNISSAGQNISNVFGSVKDVLNRDQGLFEVDRLSAATDNLLGSAMRNLTPAEDRRFANNEPFMKTFTDTFAITRPDGTKFYPDEVTSPAEIQSPTATAQPFFGEAPASNAAEAAERLINAGPAVTQEPTQAPELDPTSDEAILARRAAREAEFLNAQPTAPRSDLFPNDPGVQRTRNELMRRFGAPTIREIQEQDAIRAGGDNSVPMPGTRPGDVGDNSVPMPGTRPNLPDFIQDRQDRTGVRSPEISSSALPDILNPRSDRGREGLSQADARDLAQGLDPNASESQRMRALQIQSRLGLGQFKPERELTDLEKREIESQIRARDANIAQGKRKSDFKPRVIDVGGESAIELSPGYFQRIPKDTPSKTGLQKTLENLQADLDSGRLTQEEYDIATKNARDLYIGREEPKPAKPEETSGLIDMDGEDSELPDSLKNSNPSDFIGQTLEDKEGNRYTSDGTKWIKV